MDQISPYQNQHIDRVGPRIQVSKICLQGSGPHNAGGPHNVGSSFLVENLCKNNDLIVLLLYVDQIC